MPGKVDVAADVQSVALVMIEREETSAARKVGEAAGYGPAC
jgi:hypothetical protein